MDLKFWRKRNSEKEIIRGDIIYDFVLVDFDQLDNADTDLFDQIAANKLVGIIIKNVITPEEISTILSGLKKVPDEKKIFTKKNNLYPRGFASYMEDTSGSDSTDFENYFLKAQAYMDHFTSEFGVDVQSRLTKIFEHLASSRDYSRLIGENGLGVFPNSQFRVLYPKTGCMPVHCGNVFHVEYEKFYERLSSKARIKDQMSFFILMQKAQKGGELVLFDLLWEKGQRMIPDNHLKLANGKLVEPMKDRKVKKMVIDLQPGDMLLFAGGPIWHRVQPIKGNVDRITLGGFFTMSTDNKRIVSWA